MPMEIIVSNDCSTDNTQKLLEGLKVKIPILRVINQPLNLGITNNTDHCLREAKGEFIVRLDSDDFLEENFCDVLSQLLIAYPSAGYAHANVHEVDQFGNFLRNRVLYRTKSFENSDLALKNSIRGYRVSANIIMFRKLALIDVDYLRNRPDFAEDYHLAVNIAVNGWGNAFSSAVLANYRVWVGHGTIRRKRKLNELNGLFSVFNDMIEPAYDQRAWNKAEVNAMRTKIACTQADCLSWDIYDEEEKNALTAAVERLSNSKKTAIYVWAYKNGYADLLNFGTWTEKKIKSAAKRIILYYKS